MKEKLAELRKSIKALVALGENITDEQAEKLADLNKQAVKFEALVAAGEQQERAEKDDAARIEREKREAVEEAVRAEAAKHRRLETANAPYVTQFSETSKYDGLDVVETALVIDTLNSQNKRVSGGAMKALSLKIGELKNSSNTREEADSINYMRNNFSAYTGIKADMPSIEAAVKAATDPMYTGGSGIGSDWVGTQYSSEIWRALRAANVVVNRVPSTVIPDGFSGTIFPLEGADPTWYKTPEVTASDATMKVPAATVTASQAATANKSITVGKISARVLYSGEMVEDSLIPFASQLREQMQISGSEIIEHLFIDGDTETSANKNINDIAGTPTSTDVFLTLDGFRKLALVTNTANSRSASGAFSVDDFIETLKLMGVAGLAADPRQVAFLLDFNMRFSAMKLPEAKLKDTYTNATFENGFLAQAFGYQVLYAYQMHRASASTNARKVNTAGKVDLDTDANNTTGAILAVRFDQWKQAYKRRMTMETTRIANADAWEITAHCRLGLTNRDTEASAITYNVGL